MSDFHLAEDLLAQIHQHATSVYPDECCGMIFGPTGDVWELTRVLPVRNAQNEFHERDPKSFPRTARNAYFMEPREVMRALQHAREQGEELRVIYHSHPDADAYFSQEDVLQATFDGEPLHPGVAYLVLSVRKGTVAGGKTFHWDVEASTFRSEGGEWARGSAGTGS